MASTKDRILAIAGDLFARRGYAGTTIADIARELGTTTAALYYHFPSKAEILSALLAAPLADYRRIIENLESHAMTPEELLGAFVDLTVDSRILGAVIDRDPSVMAVIDEQLPGKAEGMTAQMIALLTGPDPDRGATIRAHAALSLIRGATQVAIADTGTDKMADRDDVLRAEDRAEIINAALRALGPVL